MENNNPGFLEKFKTLPKGQRVLIVIGLLLLLGSLLPDKDKTGSRYSLSSGSESCIGNEGCISNVRENFSATGKTILGEEYLGNGRFGITFLDAQRPGEAYTAKVSTDCNCNVVDVSVSVAR